MKTKRELISTIAIVRGNLSHIESSGVINGTLLIEIERVMEEYAQQQIKNNIALDDVSNIPNYTLVWNVVDMLCTSKKISNDSKIDIFKALTKLESEGKCTMGDLPSDVY